MMFLFLAHTASAENFFTENRFHYGAGNASGALLNEIDYMTAWAGSSQSFNLGSFFTNCKNNNKTPVIISYIIAFTARADMGLKDCNVGTPNLCQQGANYIRQNMPKILSVYASYAKGAETNFGSANKMIWCMEPDYTQYAESGQTGGGLTNAEAGADMGMILDTISHYAPNSVFSMDISPWKNETFQTTWFAAMNIKRFSFINTSGGQSTPGSTFISNTGTGCPTWKWVYQTFGTPMIADADYGVAGSPTAFITAWQDATTMTTRISEGVIAVCHNQTPSNLVTDIIAVRSKLPATKQVISGSGTLAPFEKGDIAALNPRALSNGFMEIIDLSGRIIYTKKITNETVSLDAWKGNGLQMRPGAYIIRMQGDNQCMQKKVFINK